MRVRGSVLGLRTLSRFALIGMIGGGAAACSSDASRLGDPFTNPFSSLAGEPSATGSLPDEGAEGDLASTPAIRTPRVQSQALPAPALSPRPTALGPSPTPAAARVATAEPIGAVAGMNPDAGRAMTPRASAPAPAPRLQFGKPIDKAAEKAAERAAERKAAEAVAAKAAERAAEKAAEAKREAERQAAVVKAAEAKIAEAKIAEAKIAEKAAAAKVAETKKLADVKKAVEAKKAAEAEAKKAESKLADAKKHVRPGQTAKVETKSEAKSEAKADPKAEARKSAEAEAARKAEAEARQAKADATKKLAEARAAESAAKATAAKEAKEAKDRETRQAAASAPAPTVKVASAEATAPVAAPAAPAQTAESFRWPAKGRIINGYGTGGNEGINIAVPEGTPVKAAEDGTVAYAGSDVKGYGKLVLVRHTNGYVSAYAHNGELDVRPGEKVRRGQTIAKSGATGNVTSPQLHFEIRKGATPVDPVPHLASN
ncbi:M23 family metallopeptidase [Methylobacterium sp. Leaf118]|uniref:M23 family metallopeptidase n=1 Tax=Methylobacterium sp. Leaf118 TaxID=2876562 RepID=UPI001E6067BD|nr:M23 family metallopeptidase [Methylobacterium sp. Leaf118]